MKFPMTNKKHREPIPATVESNAKLLEEKLKEVDWKFFARGYTYILGYVLVTVTSLIVVVGIAKWLIKLLNLWL